MGPPHYRCGFDCPPLVTHQGVVGAAPYPTVQSTLFEKVRPQLRPIITQRPPLLWAGTAREFGLGRSPREVSGGSHAESPVLCRAAAWGLGQRSTPSCPMHSTSSLVLTVMGPRSCTGGPASPGPLSLADRADHRGGGEGALVAAWGLECPNTNAGTYTALIDAKGNGVAQ